MNSSSEHPFRRRLAAELRSVPRAFFWTGVLWLVLGTVITFVPGSEVFWFAIATLLLASGFFVQQRRYHLFALVLIVVSSAMAIDGHMRIMEERRHSKLERASAVP
jgi:hypothetical protein